MIPPKLSRIQGVIKQEFKGIFVFVFQMGKVFLRERESESERLDERKRE
jgi:hypothetical protein